MVERFVSRGFVGKRREAGASNRVPPGQHVTQDFPVLSAGPTPRIPLDQWTFSIEQLGQQLVTWNWEQFQQLPAQQFVVDIHCVTTWSKLDTRWEGVSVDVLLEQIDIDPRVMYVTAYSYGGYTTNIPLAEIINGKAFVGYNYGGQPLDPEHGGPARLVVPHLYFWKSAKWVKGLKLMERDKSGFWESFGYNNHGDPWKEERYSGD